MPNYTIKSFKPRKVWDPDERAYTDQIKKDQFGNTYYDVVLTDEAGAEHKLSKSFRSEPTVGSVLHGQITEIEGENGTYLKFTPDKPAQGFTAGPKWQVTPAQQTPYLSLMQAVAFHQGKEAKSSDVVQTAEEFYTYLQRKETPTTNPKGDL